MAQTTTRTANQIIDIALKRIGNTTIAADARIELNSILDRLYVDFRWPFLKTITTGTIAEGGQDVALPSNFVDLWDRQSLHLIDPDSDNARIPLTTVSQQEYDTYLFPEKQSRPTKVLVDYNTLTWTPYPLPNKEYSYELVYRAKPTQITDFDAVVNFPNEALLEQMIFAWACQFEDDERAMQEMALAEKLMRQFLKSFNVNTGKNGVMALRPSRFKTMGWSR